MVGVCDSRSYVHTFICSFDRRLAPVLQDVHSSRVSARRDLTVLSSATPKAMVLELFWSEIGYRF